MASTQARPTIRQSLLDAKTRGAIGLVPFVPAGYPNLTTTRATLQALARSGAAVIEVGFPFSDPIADGPIIQEAFTASLANKLRVGDIFATIREVRGDFATPLAAMISFSLVFRYGVERFCAEARAAGFDGLIIPDLPPPEAQAICHKISAAGLESILLIAPTTEPSRRADIAKLCTGFVYYLSVSGITGERDQLPQGLETIVNEIKRLTQTPVCVGFGLHSPAQIGQLARFADGAIVGSAIVRRMKDKLHEPAESIAIAVQDYVSELVRAQGYKTLPRAHLFL